MNKPQTARKAVLGSLTVRPEAIGSIPHRARSASRSKLYLTALRGSGRSVGRVDESATGSVNFFLQRAPLTDGARAGVETGAGMSHAMSTRSVAPAAGLSSLDTAERNRNDSEKSSRRPRGARP